jgi:hypothetical protein
MTSARSSAPNASSHARVAGAAFTVKKSTMMLARRSCVSGRHSDTKTAPAYWTSS